MPGVIKVYVRWVDRVSDAVGLVAMYLAFAMVAILLLDAVTRNVVKIPLHWCIELAQFTLAAYYFLGGPVTLKNNDHVRMDLLYDRLTPLGKAKLDTITISCLIFYLGVMLYGSISSLVYAIETGERRFSMWNPSMIPIKALMVACLVLMLLQAAALFFRHLAAWRGEELA
jgi:TRAP-type mannitol/chloroaromatic compound transport system permease small subunit